MPTTKPFSLVILGYSRSGKDTFLKALRGRYHNAKFAAPFKRNIEDSFGLPHGALESPEYREATVPGTDKTYLDLMIEAYHHTQWYSSQVWQPATIREAKEAMHYGLDVAFTDCRKTEEADRIIALGAPIFTVRLTRPGLEPKSSDHQLGNIWEMLLPHSLGAYECHNNGTQEILETKARAFEQVILNATKGLK